MAPNRPVRGARLAQILFNLKKNRHNELTFVTNTRISFFFFIILNELKMVLNDSFNEIVYEVIKKIRWNNYCDLLNLNGKIISLKIC